MGAIKTAFQTWNGLAPESGPLAIPLDFDFTSAASFDVDLFLEEANKQIDFVQSIFIDQSGNGSPLQIRFFPIGHLIAVRQRTQGWYPVLSGDQTRFTITSTMSANNQCRIILSNVPMPTFQWLSQ